MDIYILLMINIFLLGCILIIFKGVYTMQVENNRMKDFLTCVTEFTHEISPLNREETIEKFNDFMNSRTKIKKGR